MDAVHSQHEFSRAKSILVGGVNSPVRAFKGVGGTPLFFKSGVGAELLSIDDNVYIDYVLSWGPLLLGHAHPKVTGAIHQAVDKGLSFGAPTLMETELAQLIQFFYPHMSKIRFVNSGTEAGMSALRLARGFTGRSKIIKFSGCYHGHSDALLVASGSGGLTLGVPDSAGVTTGAAQDTIVLDYNDTDAIRSVFRLQGNDIAAVILEPVAGNMGVILPELEFLETIRNECNHSGALLIFDEVMCGFRLHPQGISGLYGITPDLTMLGKVIGGGLPCGAYGGREDVMMHVAPEGSVYQAGTLSGNPVVMSSGIATLSVIKHTNAIETASELTQQFVSELRQALTDYPIEITQIGTMFSLFFTSQTPTSLKDVMTSDIESFQRMYHQLLAGGIYFPPSAYESCFTSIMHTERHYQKTSQAIIASVSSS